jgi:hypothetical protein
MSIATRVLPDNRSVQSEITRYLLPYKMERVIGKPHVLTPSGNAVRSRDGLEHRVPCLRGVADVRFVVEQTQLRRVSELQATQQDGGKDCAMPEPEKAGLIWSRRSSRGAHGFGLTRQTGLHTQFCEASRHGGYSLWRERGAEQFLAMVNIQTAPRAGGMTPRNGLTARHHMVGPFAGKRSSIPVSRHEVSRRGVIYVGQPSCRAEQVKTSSAPRIEGFAWRQRNTRDHSRNELVRRKPAPVRRW